jgi:hypothetical protein
MVVETVMVMVMMMTMSTGITAWPQQQNVPVMNSEGNDVTINLTSTCKAVDDHDDCTDGPNKRMFQ